MALAALVCLLAFAATAKAEIVHFQEAFSPINGTGDAVLQKPFALAIDEATGNVFVGETDGRNQVSILGAQGGAPVDLLSPFTVTGFNASGTNQFRAGAVAYDDDPSSPGFGNLYIPDTVAGNVARKVRIYTRNLVTERYEQTGELVPDPIVSAFPRPYGVAIDPDGDVWVADVSERALIKFDPTTGDELMRIDMVPVFPHTQSTNTGSPEQIAFSASGDLFVMESPRFAAPFPRVLKWVADGSGEIDTSQEPLVVPNTSGAWGMTVDRSENFLYIAFSDHVDQYDVDTLAKVGEFGSGVLVNARGVAVNESNGRVYVADNGVGQKNVRVFGPSVRTAIVEVSPATGISTSAATMNGSVSAQGSPLSFCRFEYGTSDEYGETVPCPGIIPANMNSHPVSVPLSGLDPNTTYHYRLVAENASGIVSRSTGVTFTTRGKPTVSHTLPIWVDRETAKVGAYVNPSGFATNYRFEWGPTGDYGHTIPADFEPSLPAGTERVKVVANLTGLSPATAYHFRVVATNASGTTYGPDQRFETLNSCGFILDRCLELVSSGDTGFTGSAGDQGISGDGVFFEAAASGSSIVYPVTFGFSDATTGGEVVYRSERGDAEWAHEQLSPETPAPSTPTYITNFQSRVLGFSRDMSCFAFISGHQFTPDAPRAAVEAGFVNMFLRDRDGETRVVTSRPIEGEPGQAFNSTRVVSISDDCGKVVFHSDYRYVGLAGAGDNRLYEWERASGELRAISEVPGPSGAEVVPVNPGAASAATPPATTAGWQNANRFNALSADGRRVFITARRKLGDGPAGAGEVDKWAVFARVDGSETVDISQSQTTTPNAGALYQLASRDGGKVLFTANHGLTEAPDPDWPTSCDHDPGSGFDLYRDTGSGCDLYEYDFSRPDGARLVNLSLVDGVENIGGAGVVGAVAASEDASKVYFLARGRLVPGIGPSEAQNLADDTYSLYLRSGEGIQFVAAVGRSDVVNLLVNDNVGIGGVPWRAQATPSGTHLVFPAKANVTGDDASEAEQAYRFDAETGRTVCVSCLRNGGEPVIVDADSVLEPFTARQKPRRAITDDGRSIYFIKRDVMAPGAVEGRRNLYEWRDGQISYLGSSFIPEVVPGNEGALKAAGRGLTFIGASADGTDVYFTTRDRLTWQDNDDLFDVYTARGGGGIPEPPPPPEPCVGDACQGPVTAPPPAWDIASFAFIGDGNASPGVRSALGVAKPSRRAIRRAARTGRLAVAVRTDRAGVVRVLARARIGKRIRRVAGKSVRVRKAGRARLTLRLSPLAKRTLRKGKALKLTIQVRSPGARSRSIGVRLPGGKS